MKTKDLKDLKILVDGKWLHWYPRNPPEERQLIKWTKAKLEEERVIINAFIHAGDGLAPRPPPSFEWAKEVYDETGDRSLLQQVVDPIYKVRGIRGRPPTEKHGDPMWEAVWDVIAIKRIWQEHFGHKNRPEIDAVRAEKIAAERWNVDLATLGEWVRKNKKP